MNAALIGKIKLQPRLSPMFRAILGYVLDQPGWATPAIIGLSITSDGFLIAQVGPPVDHAVFLGTADELDRNVRGLFQAAGITDGEATDFWRAAQGRITDWRN